MSRSAPWPVDFALFCWKCVKQAFRGGNGCTEDQMRIAKLEAEKAELMDALDELLDLHEHEMHRPAVLYSMGVLKKARSRP